MEGTLSKALQKNYTRVGNRIIFSNGMTLNQLALEMWERLGYQGIDASVISRVIKGKRLFTPKQLEEFCQVLSLSILDKSMLRQALYHELSARLGLGEEFFQERNKYFIDMVEDNLDKIKRVRERDSLDLASQWIDQLWNRLIQELTKKAPFSYRKKLLNMMGQALIERKRTLFVVFKTDKPSKEFLELPTHLIRIGNEIKNEEILGIGYAALANIFSHEDQLEDSINTNTIAIDLLEDYTEKAVSLSRIGIAFAKLRREKDYLSVKRNLFKQFRLYPDHSKCYVIQAMAQAETYLGLFNLAEESLYYGWDIFFKKLSKSQNYHNVRKLQLIRSEILRLSLMSGKKEKRKQDWIEQGVSLANMLGFNVGSNDDVTKLSHTSW